MAKFRSIKNSFLGGQISPTVWGRTDLPQYNHSCQLMLNMIPMLSGGAYRRPGTLNINTYASSGYTAPRIFPFIVSKQETYALVVSNLFAAGAVGNCVVDYYRLTGNRSGEFSNGSASGTLPYSVGTDLTAAAAAAAGYPYGLKVDDEINRVQHCQSADIMWLTHPNHKPKQIRRTAVDTFSCQDYDYGLSGWDFIDARPYLNQNTTGITLQPGATTGSTTLTASSPLFNALHVGATFIINQGGTLGACYVTGFTSSTVVSITVYATFATAAVAYATWWESAWSDYRGWPATCCIFQQRLVMGGAFGSASVKGQMDSIWFSETANYNVFSLLGSTVPGYYEVPGSGKFTSSSAQYKAPVDDSEGDGQTTGPTGSQPFRITLTQDTTDEIRWLSPDKELLIGTAVQEYIVSPANQDFSIGNSPTVLQSKYGSSDIPAVRIGYELIFSLGSGDEVVAYQYNYIDASFFAEPVQLLFDQYPKAEDGSAPFTAGRRRVKQIGWDVSRKTLWCLDTNGNFYGMTRDRKLSTTMWHTHQFGGYDATKGHNSLALTGNHFTVDPAYYTCDGSVISFAIVPNPYSGINDIWLLVKRTISNVTQWQLEIMMGKNTVRNSCYESTFPGLGFTEPYAVDACVSGSGWGDGGASKSIPYTAPHLNGHTLIGTYYSASKGIFKMSTDAVVAGDASFQSPLPSDYGSASAFMAVGLPYTPTLEPVRVEAGSVIGTAQGAIARINRAFVRVFKSISCMVGMTGGDTESAAERVYFRDWSAPIGKSPEIFTGYKKVLIPSAYDREGTLIITEPDPFPFTLTSIIMEGEEYDS